MSPVVSRVKCELYGLNHGNFNLFLVAMERLDPDHQLLLRNTKPLLQSRNAAVCQLILS